MEANKKKRSDQEVHDFLKSLLEVGEGYVDELENELKQADKKLKVSDILDENDHQYVNLVQQGGGMLGIALLGYTYVLERMGIRFLKLAGTSAGAINATLMASLGPANTRTLKSPIILYYLAQKNLFDLVDGHPFARWLLKGIIKHKNTFLALLKSILYLLAFNPIILFASFLLFFWNGLRNSFVDITTIKLAALFIDCSLIISLSLLVITAVYFWKRFEKSQFGINPGREFHKWIADLMLNGEVHEPGEPNKPLRINLTSGKAVNIYNTKNGIDSLQKLETELSKIPPLKYNYGKSELHLIDERPLAGLDEYDKDEPSLAIITTELVTENKIVFPKMWRLFYRDHAHVLPADFVRASMSIPFFFEAFRIRDIPKREDRANDWMKYLRYDGNTIDEAVFVDGGSLSNFPINVFNPTRVSIPRLPTFGVRLQSQGPADSRSVKTLKGIMASILSTMKSYYDKDFL